MGALGGNLSTLSTNPAGIGIYRSGEFSFTPALKIGQTNTTPDNDKQRMGEQWNFNLGNLGWVGVIDLSSSESKNEWKKIQFGIGLNRQTDFWNQSRYNRYASSKESYLGYLTETDGLSGDLAEKADLIYQDPDYFDPNYFGGDYYHNDLTYWDEFEGDYFDAPVRQSHTTKTTGAINEWVFSFGGNYGDQLFIGATIGVPVVNYKITRSLMEENADEFNPNFNNWKIQEKLNVSGNGINLKLGAIYKPADFIRLGLAFHSPTRYNLDEKFSIDVSGDTRYADPDEHFEEINDYEYNLRTPMRLIASAGFVIGKKAVVGVEYEHLNYSKMLLNDEWSAYDDYNDYIADNYSKGGTVRVGGEYRLDPVCLRLGYNYTMSPYADNSFNKFSQQTISAGLGFTIGSSMMLDFAYANTLRNYNNIPYPSIQGFENVNKYKMSGQQFLVTLGWRF
jgi:hypothetical protein